MRSLLLPILLCICCCSLAAPITRISPEPGWLFKNPVAAGKAPAANSIGSGYYVEMADQQFNLVSNTAYTHIIRHIVNSSGVQNASEVSVSFSPSFQQVIYHKVVVIRNGVVVNQLKPGAIKVVQEETDAGDFQYNGLKRAFVILKDVQQGDRIEFAYSVIGSNPVFGNKYSDVLYFYNSTPVANYFITLIAPAGRKLLLKPFNNAPVPEEKLQGDTRIYHWDNPAVQVMATESSTPSWYNQYPYTTVTEYNSWEEVIRWGLDLFHHYKFTLPPGLQTQIAGWRKTANGDKDLFADLATHFVQDQVRYLGLEIGTYTHQPHTPTDVYLHRFGDCKDKALLLATILQQENIPAYVALVNTSTRQALKDAAPSAQEFDHAIVAIERSQGYLFVDATVNLQRGELASRFIPAYGYALVVREGAKKLEPVEPGFRYTTTIEETMNAPFYDSARLDVITTYSGGAADNVRGSVANTSVAEIQENYRQFYEKSFEGVRANKPLVLADDSDKNQYIITEHYTMPGVWHTNDKGKKVLDVFARSVYERLTDPSALPAGAPMALPYPRNFNYTIDIKMPEEWVFSTPAWHVKTDSYEFSFRPEVFGRRITLQYSLETFKDHVPAEEMAQYKRDYKKMVELLEFELSFGYDNTTSPGSRSTDPDTEKIINAYKDYKGPSRLTIAGVVVVFLAVMAVLFIWLLKPPRQRKDYL